MAAPLQAIPLARLKTWQLLACSAAMVSRMYPNFVLFCELTDSDVAAKYQAMLDLAWEQVRKPGVAIDFTRQQLKAEALMPDANAFDMYGVWPAIDAVTALVTLMGMCEVAASPKADLLVEEGYDLYHLGVATIESYAECCDDAQLITDLLAHWQDFVVQLCVELELTDSRTAAIEHVRALLQDEPSLIGISLGQ